MIRTSDTRSRSEAISNHARRPALWVALALCCAGSLVACGSSGASATGKSQSGAGATTSISMGIEPWLGYGAWYIAQDQGYFAKNHLKVKIVNFEEDAQIDTAFVSGSVDVANIATNTLLQLAAASQKLKAVLLEDESLTADAILAPKNITSVADLKGKSVAYEQGTTSDVLLHHALAQAGLKPSDINVVPVAAADVPAALVAGKVQVGVTYQPYISTIMNESQKFHDIYTAGEDPGLISDVLVGQPSYIQSHPVVFKELVQSWNEAVNYYNSHGASAKAIIAKGVGATPSSLSTSFDGVKIYTVPEAKTALTGSYVTTAMPDVYKAAQTAGLIKGTVSDFGSLVDPTFVKQVG